MATDTEHTRPEIILASSSAYRRELLQRLHLSFSVVPPEIDESPRPAETGRELVLRLTESKARAVAQGRPRAIVIASDQVALLGEQVIGKPGNRANAARQLQQQSGRTVEFLTGLAVLNSATGALQIDCVACAVTFSALTDRQIDRYLELDAPFDCAGSFKSEAFGIALLSSMSCPDPTALIGLPLIRLAAMLTQAGIDPFEA